MTRKSGSSVHRPRRCSGSPRECSGPGSDRFPRATAVGQASGDWTHYTTADNQGNEVLAARSESNASNFGQGWKWRGAFKTDILGPRPRVQTGGHAARDQRRAVYHRAGTRAVRHRASDGKTRPS